MHHILVFNPLWGGGGSLRRRTTFLSKIISDFSQYKCNFNVKKQEEMIPWCCRWLNNAHLNVVYLSRSIAEIQTLKLNLIFCNSKSCAYVTSCKKHRHSMARRRIILAHSSETEEEGGTAGTTSTSPMHTWGVLVHQHFWRRALTPKLISIFMWQTRFGNQKPLLCC